MSPFYIGISTEEMYTVAQIRFQACDNEVDPQLLGLGRSVVCRFIGSAFFIGWNYALKYAKVAKLGTQTPVTGSLWVGWQVTFSD